MTETKTRTEKRLTPAQRRVLTAFAAVDGPREDREVIRETGGTNQTRDVIFRLVEAGMLVFAGYSRGERNMHQATFRGRCAVAEKTTDASWLQELAKETG